LKSEPLVRRAASRQRTYATTLTLDEVRALREGAVEITYSSS
jgi:hypothetical protein